MLGDFNPRALTGRDSTRRFLRLHARNFNPRALTGRDKSSSSSSRAQILFQSTRPHGARQYLPCKERRIMVISIHAPSRGATAETLKLNLTELFQSTRPHGARLVSNGTLPTETKFQSTRPHGARQRLLLSKWSRIQFQSTRPHGARLHTTSPSTRQRDFNPRALTGRDKSNRRTAHRPANFNPRALTGRDQDDACILKALVISIHAPSRGATRAASRKCFT